MAAETATVLPDFDIFVKNERYVMNKLRDKGLEYVSSSGKVVAAKTQPVLFCHCPQKCKSKLPLEKWNALFKQFYELGDQNTQNQFLQTHIVIKAVHLHNWESEKSSPANKRRVTCRYHVPDLGEDSKLEDYVKWKGNDSIEVCQKAFMNCYGITEKRVRMQRERCISRLAPGHYKHSPFGKRHKQGENRQDGDDSKHNAEDSNDLEITPLDLRNDEKKKLNGQRETSTSEEESLSESDDKQRPLDLSHSKQTNPPSADIYRSKFFEIGEEIGLSKDRINKKMTRKYEELVKLNFKKLQKPAKNKRKRSSQSSPRCCDGTEIENRSPGAKAIAEQVVGLGDDLTILPIQTLNNGDLTITPVLGPVARPVENRDIMRVNTFFQNQLWKPEYIGLSSWRKLRTQTFDI